MQSINNFITKFISFSSQEVGTFWQHLDLLNFSYPQVAIDILMVSVLFYYLFSLLRGTRAVHILIGLTILAFIFLMSKWLDLVAIGWLLDNFLTVTLVAIPVIFQQELRMALEKLGRTKIFHNQTAEDLEHITRSILSAVEQLQSKKTGALIVLKKEVSLSEYTATGVSLDADVSKELLINIFQPKSPLHDGAIVIEGNKISAAACILPPSFKSYGHDFGTRHKAAIGLSEETDAQVIVVSEEKGTVSYSRNGRIDQNITIERLQRLLTQFYRPKKK